MHNARASIPPTAKQNCSREDCGFSWPTWTINRPSPEAVCLFRKPQPQREPSAEKVDRTGQAEHTDPRHDTAQGLQDNRIRMQSQRNKRLFRASENAGSVQPGQGFPPLAAHPDNSMLWWKLGSIGARISRPVASSRHGGFRSGPERPRPSRRTCGKLGPGNPRRPHSTIAGTWSPP